MDFAFTWGSAKLRYITEAYFILYTYLMKAISLSISEWKPLSCLIFTLLQVKNVILGNDSTKIFVLIPKDYVFNGILSKQD